MDPEALAEIRKSFAGRKTSELVNIWTDNDRGQYADVFFQALEVELQGRSATPLPAQRPWREEEAPAHQKFQLWDGVQVVVAVAAGVGSLAMFGTSRGVPPWFGLLLMGLVGGVVYYLVRLARLRWDPIMAQRPRPVLTIPVVQGRGCGCPKVSGCGTSGPVVLSVGKQEVLLPVVVVTGPLENLQEVVLYANNPSGEPFYVRGEVAGKTLAEGMLGANDYLRLAV
ncbi:MAG: hypothetical protein HQL55_18530, partial [Magnetococcales bacterium]|nr:hypothetical protein [Magnetococcales bacterium]